MTGSCKFDARLYQGCSLSKEAPTSCLCVGRKEQEGERSTDADRPDVDEQWRCIPESLDCLWAPPKAIEPRCKKINATQRNIATTQMFYIDTAAILRPSRSKDRATATVKEGWPVQMDAMKETNVHFYGLWTWHLGGAGASYWDTKALYSNNPDCPWCSVSRILTFACFLYTRQRIIDLFTIWNSSFDADSGEFLSWKVYSRRFGLKFFCTEGRVGRALFILIHTFPHKCANETIHNNTWAGGGTRRRWLSLLDSTDTK